MATAESVKSKILGLIDQSNATTGNSDTDLTTAVGSLIAGFGQGGGSIEYGEFISTTSTFWKFTIPVSAKKNHFLLVPKSPFSALFANHKKGSSHMLYAEEGKGNIVIRLSAANNETETKLSGASYWISELDTEYVYEFTDTEIICPIYMAPLNDGFEYLWFAW